MAALVKTPLKAPLHLPTRPWREAVAAEWEAQGETIDPASMIITKLANTAIDRVPARPRAAIAAEVLDFANSDLVCYRADRARRIWWQRHVGRLGSGHRLGPHRTRCAVRGDGGCHPQPAAGGGAQPASRWRSKAVSDFETRRAITRS